MFVEMFIAYLYVSSTLENCMFYIDLKVFYRKLLDPRPRFEKFHRTQIKYFVLDLVNVLSHSTVRKNIISVKTK